MWNRKLMPELVRFNSLFIIIIIKKNHYVFRHFTVIFNDYREQSICHVFLFNLHYDFIKLL